MRSKWLSTHRNLKSHCSFRVRPCLSLLWLRTAAGALTRDVKKWNHCALKREVPWPPAELLPELSSGLDAGWQSPRSAVWSLVT